MENIFIKLFNMSVTAGWLILAVILIRLIFRKAPKSLQRFMWILVGIRLVCPFSFESILSLIPSSETVPQNIAYAEIPQIKSGIEALNSTVNPIMEQSLSPNVAASINPMQIILAIASLIWIIGVSAMLVYALISYIRLKIKMAGAVRLRDNIYQSENTASPFVLGLIKPKIYIPFGMHEAILNPVIAHENSHIRHFDHIIKLLGFLLLTIYWFNPLVWIAYILLCRDIESACDERVIKKLGADERKWYSLALLECGVSRKSIAACPVAFGEVGVKQRVKNVLSYKKPAFWIIIAAIICCVVIAVCFMTNPLSFDSSYLDLNKVISTLRVQQSLNVIISDGSNDTYSSGTVSGKTLGHYIGSLQLKNINAPEIVSNTPYIVIWLGYDDPYYVINLIQYPPTLRIVADGHQKCYEITEEHYNKVLSMVNDKSDHEYPPVSGYAFQECLYTAPQISYVPMGDTGQMYYITSDEGAGKRLMIWDKETVSNISQGDQNESGAFNIDRWNLMFSADDPYDVSGYNLDKCKYESYDNGYRIYYMDGETWLVITAEPEILNNPIVIHIWKVIPVESYFNSGISDWGTPSILPAYSVIETDEAE